MTTSADLNAKIAALVDQLANATDAARLSDVMARYLDSMAAFHNYSFGNLMLIAHAMPTATRVAGYKTWQKVGRQVRKGEKGIAILAPCTYREKDANGEPTDQTRVFFKTVYVFDVSQTDGEPLPEAPTWRSPEQSAELHSRLIGYAQSLGITVTVRDLAGQTQGTSSGGHIELAPTAGTKTFLHELAHELMHKAAERATLARELLELQAESVAYVVAQHFGLQPEGSPNYLALWGADGKAVRETLGAIQRTAAEIIGAVEGAALVEAA